MKNSYTLARIFLFIGAAVSPDSHSFVVVSFRKPPAFPSSNGYSNQVSHKGNLKINASPIKEHVMKHELIGKVNE